VPPNLTRKIVYLNAKMVERRDRNGDGELTAADLRRRHHDEDKD
jgi:hypothetical protein